MSLFTVNGSCYNAEAGNKEDCNPKRHNTVVTGLRIIVRLITTGSGRNAYIVFAGIALAIVVSVCVSSLAVLDDNATTYYAFSLVIFLLILF